MSLYISQAVKAFALALDDVIKSGGDPMDNKRLAAAMLGTSFNFSTPTSDAEHQYKFTAKGDLIQGCVHTRVCEYVRCTRVRIRACIDAHIRACFEGVGLDVLKVWPKLFF